MNVDLVRSMAGDIDVVNAARVSFNKSVTEVSSRDEKLIHYLMTNGHGSPFEHSTFQFRVRCPIFVAREWMRHRWSSFNEWSFRWGELPLDFYVPDAYVPEHDANHGWRIEDAYAYAKRAYDLLIENGVPRELARSVLPMGTYTEFYWTVNARALMNFIMLRNHPAAQPEIQELAVEVEQHFADHMPITHEAFVKAGRKAP